LSALTNLTQLDISENEVCRTDNFRDQVFAALPNLQILDGKDRDGESFYSDDDLDEEGEIEDEELQNFLSKLDPETKRRF
jgi:hypothetical protein